MERKEEVQKFLDEVLAPILREKQEQGLDKVSVILEDVDESGVVSVEFQGLKTCGAFCACETRAKVSLSKAIEQLMKKHISWVTKVVGYEKFRL